MPSQRTFSAPPTPIHPNPPHLTNLSSHAEPDQAAQILSQQHPQQNQSNQKPLPQIQDQARPGALDQRKYSASGGAGGPPPRTSPRPYQDSSQRPYQDPSQRPYQDPRHSPYEGRSSSYSSKNPPIPPAGGGGGSSYNNTQYGHSPPLAPIGRPNQNHNNNNNNYGSSISPAGLSGRSSPPARPPPTPAPLPRGGGGDPSLFPLFQAVDKHGTGHLSERELGKALVNGDFTQFDGHTVKMMIRMFDVDRNGSINFDEFR